MIVLSGTTRKQSRKVRCAMCFFGAGGMADLKHIDPNNPNQVNWDQDNSME